MFQTLVIRCILVAVGVLAIALIVVSVFGIPQRKEDSGESVFIRNGNVSTVAEPEAIRIAKTPQVVALLRDTRDTGSMSNVLAQSADDLDDEKLFNEVMQGLLAELDLASRKKDFKSVCRLVERLRSLNYGNVAVGRGGGHLVVSVKRKILDALADGGYAVAEQVVAFLDDPEPEIAQSATDLIFKTLNDLSLGDYKRAEIVSAAAGELTDKMAIIRLYQEFAKLRPTVARDTLLQISDHGTDSAKEFLPNAISALAADPTITTGEQLREVGNEIEDPEDTRPFEPIYIKGLSAEPDVR